MRARPLVLAFPAALAAVAGLACLTSALASNGGFEGLPQFAQATPPAASPPAAGGGPAAGPIRPAFSPKQFCEERVARRIGARAYLKAKLDLKPDQVSAWDAYQTAADAQSTKDKTRCAALPAEMKEPPTFVDRMNRRQEWMKSRLESLEAVKPTLLALYDKLTPEQKAVFDRPMMGRHHDGPGRHRRRG
ncbi:MAG: Spy/CpxP family protein refolding chaperone [Reyranella sp.]|uniref:Spy/CpxP family protein refolding chaperone n=1 Tax=Reyranella sp. TaxID=1929291 RepID=UPI001AD16071|nr:Spy/CpxP family protein refolding chaperone [Reyranella sp.]MBN9088317.1 Spy/CpxP family protein refolding chaperone [Reyranella sp.]